MLKTACREYAVESYDYDVLNYLMKPIQVDRFRKAIGKYYQRQVAQTSTPPPASPDAFEQACPFFRVGREHQQACQ